MPTRLVRVVTAVVLAGLLSLAGCGSRPTSEGGFVSGDGTFTTIEPGKRMAAPVLDGTTLTGGRWSSADAAGKVIVVNVWGSWCAPCRKEAPELAKAATDSSAVAVFVGINTRDNDVGAPRAFVRSFKVPYPNLYDPTGALLLRFNGQLPPNAIPSTLIIDAQGRVAARIVGASTASTLTGLIGDIAEGR